MKRSDPAYIPKSIKEIGLVTLQVTEEVMESKDFKTLKLKLSDNLETTRRRITNDYFLPAEDVHRLALKRRFQLSVCRLLTSAATGFIAEINIKNNTKHEAVMNFLATSPTSLLVEPIAKNAREFLLLYKEAHKLKFIPPPTTKHKALNSVLNEINGQELTKKRITEAMQTEKTTEITTRPTSLLANAENPSTITTTDEHPPLPTPRRHSFDTSTSTSTPQPLAPTLLPLPSFETPLPSPCPLRPNLENPYVSNDADNTTTTASTFTTTQGIQHATPTLNDDNYKENFAFDYTHSFSQEIEATKAAELLAKLRKFVKYAIHTPLHTFASTHSMQITTRRIVQATTPAIYRTTAQRIADAIQKEPPVTHQTLTGLITECATKQTSALQLKIKSLQDQLTSQRTPTDNTHQRNSKNALGSSNPGWNSNHLIWNRMHPSRNTSNQAAADTQRFPQQQQLNSTKRPRQHQQNPTSNPDSNFTHRFIPRLNTHPPTSAESTRAVQPQIKDPDASYKPARKRGWKPSKNNTNMR